MDIREILDDIIFSLDEEIHKAFETAFPREEFDHDISSSEIVKLRDSDIHIKLYDNGVQVIIGGKIMSDQSPRSGKSLLEVLHEAAKLARNLKAIKEMVDKEINYKSKWVTDENNT